MKGDGANIYPLDGKKVKENHLADVFIFPIASQERKEKKRFPAEEDKKTILRPYVCLLYIACFHVNDNIHADEMYIQ